MDLPEIPNLVPGAHDSPARSKRICVIGAGCSGLAAVRVISETPQVKSGLWTLIAFESRDNVGGIWNYAPPVDNPPQTPLYDSLTTNVPHPVMAYTSYTYPPSTYLFPEAAVVQKYMESYRDHFKLGSYIHVNIAVKRLTYTDNVWKVTTISSFSGSDDADLSSMEVTWDFDCIVVANGHYRKPLYPDVTGLAEWLEQKKATHSAWYRRPHDLGKVVLVVGGGPSGNDISDEMRTKADILIRSIPGAKPSQDGNLKTRGRVMELRLDQSTAVFEDGTTEHGIDHCILATGYEFWFPFFTESEMIDRQYPPPVPPIPKGLYNSLYSVFPLARHLFPIQGNFPSTSLAFVGLPKQVAPFPIAEAQSHAIVRVLQEPSVLDPTQESVDIITKYEALRSAGNSEHEEIIRAWHRLAEYEQFDYRDELLEFAFKGRDDVPEIPKVTEWERYCYDYRDLLRAAWKEVVRKGEQDKWVKGVGEGGQHEWVEMMKKLIEQWHRDGFGEVKKSRL